MWQPSFPEELISPSRTKEPLDLGSTRSLSDCHVNCQTTSLIRVSPLPLQDGLLLASHHCDS